MSSLDPALPGSAKAQDKVTIDPWAALAVKKTHNGTFTAGTTGSYTLAVSNTGKTESPGPVVLTDTLPGGLRFKAATGDGWRCDAKGQDVTCTRAGALAVGKAAPITLTVDILSAAFPAVVNTATVRGPGSSPATSTDTAPVGPNVVWGIDKTLAGYDNNKATYRIVVTNHGGNPTVSAATVTDKLPAGLVYLSSAGTGWVCGNVSGVVSCTYAGTIEPGGSRTVDLTTQVTAAPGTKLVNTATVDGGGSSSASVSPPGGTTPPGASKPHAGSNPAELEVTENGKLPDTGSATAPLLGFGLLLLLAGGGVLFLRGRKRVKA